MKLLSAFALVAFLASVGAPAFAGVEKNATEPPDSDLAAAEEQRRQLDQALPLTARWLLEHNNPRKRAAGLLYSVSQSGMLEAQAAMVERTTSNEQLREYDSIRQSALDALDRAETRNDDLPALEPAELLDRFEKAIRTTTDGAALAWLAAACATADIEAFCVDAGLDDAIVRHDGANLFSRLTLVPDAQAETRGRLIIEAENTQNYVSQLTAVWFEALDEGPGAAVLKRPDVKLTSAFVKLTSAFAISMAHAIPAYQPVTQACRAEITPGDELDRACGRIAERMISDSQTAIGQMVGFSLASSRAEARGDQATVTRLEQRKVFENAVHGCRATALRDDLENLDDSGARDFMKMLDQHGEIEAWA
ncbi:MAG: hypothetical protein R6V61_08600, partial [Wenzhouxiangellaceae bacterium]